MIFHKDPLQLIPFKTYGTVNHIYMKGRAIEDETIDLTKKGWYSRLSNSFKQFETDEIRDCDLVININESSICYQLKTNDEGYYLLDETLDSVERYIDKEGWLKYSVSYFNYAGKHYIQANNIFEGKMLIPHSKAEFGVISDIDDTILHTGVTSRLKWRVAFNTIFKSPEKREALEGTADFYNKLHNSGKDTQIVNPIFYVSNSPWNLYLYLEYFLLINGFPEGPIILRDFKTPFDRIPKTELDHKYQEIFNILKTYPQMRFILIGDCGEKDPYIYLDVVKQFPNRIAAIYLRSVMHSAKMSKVKRSFEDYQEVPVLIVEDTQQALEHAQDLGFIS